MNWIIDYFVPFVVVLTILVFVHELGHFLIARRNKVKVTTFSIGFGPELFGWTDSQGTRWCFSLIPLGGYVKMLGDADASSARADESVQSFTEEEKQQTLQSKTPLQRIAVSIAGPVANYILAIVLLTALIAVKGMPVLPATVGKVEPEMLAHQAGIISGDKILRINKTNVEDFDQLRALIKENIGRDVQIELNRNGETLHKNFALYTVNASTGEKEPIAKLGIAPGDPLYVKQNPITAFAYAGAFCWKMSVDTLKGIGSMITAKKGSGEIGGILSIGDMAAQSTKNGLPTVLFFMAILSINLGLINLLPIPVLDGGHILLSAIEWVRGKPLGQKIQEYIFLTGFLIVIGTMLFATWNDLMRYKIFQIIKNWF